MKLIKTKNSSEISIGYKSNIRELFFNRQSIIFDITPFIINGNTNQIETKIKDDLIKISWRYRLQIDNDWAYSIQATNEYLMSEIDKQTEKENILLSIENTFDVVCEELNKQKKYSDVVASFQTPSKISAYEKSIIYQFHLLLQKELDTYLLRV